LTACFLLAFFLPDKRQNLPFFPTAHILYKNAYNNIIFNSLTRSVYESYPFEMGIKAAYQPFILLMRLIKYIHTNVSWQAKLPMTPFLSVTLYYGKQSLHASDCNVDHLHHQSQAEENHFPSPA